MRIFHKKYGYGNVIQNHSEPLRDNELYVEFDNPLPFLKQSAIAGYNGVHTTEKTMYETKDIVSKSDITIIKD